MTRAAAALVALSLIVGGLGAFHALGDLLGMFSRGLGAAGWIVLGIGGCAYATALPCLPKAAREIVAAHRSGVA